MSPVLAITGPTAVGKSALALDVAEALGAEIVSVDSRQIYRGLDIGTAKPSLDDQARVRHHLIDERDPHDLITAGAFAEAATARIDEIRARGRVPLVVGGSTLYLTALVDGIARLPPVPPELAASISDDLRTPETRQALFDELARADPVAARTLDATKTHRLARLVGVLRATGQPPSRAWARAEHPRHRFRVVVLDRPRPELYARIDARVDAMLDQGLVDECRGLIAQGAGEIVEQTIGYREPAACLRGELDPADMVTQLKRNTRRYAKRQLTWFRRSPSYLWMDAREATARSVLDVLESTPAGRVDPGRPSPPDR